LFPLHSIVEDKCRGFGKVPTSPSTCICFIIKLGSSVNISFPQTYHKSLAFAIRMST